MVVVGLQRAATATVHHDAQWRAGTGVHCIVHAVLVVVVVFLCVRASIAVGVQSEAQAANHAAGATVSRIHAAVVVVVRVLVIGASVAVVIRFRREADHARRAAVKGVQHAVLVVVLVVAVVPASVTVVIVGGCGRPGVEIQGATVVGFQHAVVVGVVIAKVADAVAIKVGLSGVVHVGAHVRLVDPSVFIGVDVGAAVALLVFFWRGDPADGSLWARVVVVEHAVFIVVKVLVVVPAPVFVMVRGARAPPTDCAGGAIVEIVRHSVAVVVHVAGIAHAVRIEVKLVRVCVAWTDVDGIEHTVVIKVGSIGPQEHVSATFHAVFLSFQVQVFIETSGHDPTPVRIETQGGQTLVTRAAEAPGPSGVFGAAKVRQPTVVGVAGVLTVHVFEHGSAQGHARAAHASHDARTAGVDVHIHGHVGAGPTDDLHVGPLRAT